MSSKLTGTLLEVQDITCTNLQSTTGDQTDKIMSQAAVTENLNTKANYDGDYPEMSVGSADQLKSPDGDTDSNAGEPYIFRTSGGEASLSSGIAHLTYIEGYCHGGTNQAGNVVDGTTTITVATPTTFKSLGLNAFNADSSHILSGYTISNTGAITSDSTSIICYVKAVGGITSSAAGDAPVGYTIYDKSDSGHIVRVGYSSTVPVAGGTVILSGSNNVVVQGSMFPAYGGDLSATKLRTIQFPNNGYVCVAFSGTSATAATTTAAQNLCIHPQWSGYENLTWEAYGEYFITIPTVDANGNDLPSTEHGFPSVGNVKDKIDFASKKYIQNVGYLPYTAENLSTVQSYNVNYIYDSNSIYYVLASPIALNLKSEVTQNYYVADFGTEEFVGTTVGVYATHWYPANLRDKLRTDVVTKSTDLVDNLKSTATTKVLTANQGRVLNEQKADVSGTYPNMTVGLANNLYSPSKSEDTDAYVFRPSGGSADLSDGDATLSIVKGSAYQSATGQTITVFNPKFFRSIGFNQVDKSGSNGRLLSNCTINGNGQIVASSGSYVALIHAFGYNHVIDLGTGSPCALNTVSSWHGWTIYSSVRSSVGRIGWVADGTMPALGTTTTLQTPTSNGATYEGTAISEYVNFADTGWLCVATTNIDALCVHMKWSGYRDGLTADYEEWDPYLNYEETLIAIPTADAVGTDLPTASYGMPAVGDVADEIRFEAKRYIQRIGRLPYSAENIASMTTSYIYDSNWIYYVLPSAITYTLASTVESNYTVSDFGTEEFTNASYVTLDSVSNHVLSTTTSQYLENLRDKLRRDVLTKSEDVVDSLTSTETRKALSANQGRVLNEKKANVDGNYPNMQVGFAENIIADDNQKDIGEYYFRTSGGSVDIGGESAHLVSTRGGSHVPGYTTESIASSVTQAARISASVSNKTTLINWIKSLQPETPSGEDPYIITEFTFALTYDGTDWNYLDSAVSLSNLGLSVTGTPSSGDSLTVDVQNIDFDNPSSATVAITVSEAPDKLTVEVTAAGWRASGYGQVVGTNTFTFTYSSSSSVWSCSYDSSSYTTAQMASSLGLTISGTPINSDVITIDYTKEDVVTDPTSELYTGYTRIEISKPSTFQASGINQCNPSNFVSGKALNSSGAVVSGSNYVGYVHAVGCDEGSGTGYLVYNPNGGLVRVGWIAEKTFEDTGKTISGLTGVTVATDSSKGITVEFGTTSTTIIYPDHGYLIIETSNASATYVHPKWSGTSNTNTTAYVAYSTITMPTVCYEQTDVSQTTPISIPAYGLACVGVGYTRAYDEFDFSNRKYIKRVGRAAYSTALINALQADGKVLGVDYIYDHATTIPNTSTSTSGNIFYVLPYDASSHSITLDDTVVKTYNLANSVSNTYTVNDYGTEEYLFGSNPKVAMESSHLYGQNLRDKLRRNVVVKNDLIKGSSSSSSLAYQLINGTFSGTPSTGALADTADYTYSEMAFNAPVLADALSNIRANYMLRSNIRYKSSGLANDDITVPTTANVYNVVKNHITLDDIKTSLLVFESDDAQNGDTDAQKTYYNKHYSSLPAVFGHPYIKFVYNNNGYEWLHIFCRQSQYGMCLSIGYQGRLRVAGFASNACNTIVEH